MDEMIIERKEYLDRLIAKRENGFVILVLIHAQALKAASERFPLPYNKQNLYFA